MKKWRCHLWNKVYTPMLRGSTSFVIFTILMKNHKDELTMKRVIYRCFTTIDYFEIIKSISIGDIALNLFIDFL